MVSTFSPADVPNASPKDVSYELASLYGTVTGTYADTPGTLTATGAVKFSVGTGDDVTTAPLSLGDTLNIFFDTAAVDAAPEGSIVSGVVSNGSGFLLTPSMTVDRSPAPYEIGDLENIEVSTTVTSGNQSMTGYHW